MNGISRILRNVVTLGLLCVSPALAAPPRLALVPGDAAPDMRGLTAEGDYFAIDYAAGNVTVINFWATWCQPCREEMSKLDELFQRRVGDGLQVAGVHAGIVEQATLGEYLSAVPVNYPIVLPEPRYVDAWGGVSVLPMTFLVDGQGTILRRYIGATPEQLDGLLFDIEAALEGRELGPVIIPEKPLTATDEKNR